MSNFENYGSAERFSTATCLTLFDKIPEWRLPIIDRLSNDAGIDAEILRNTIEISSEDPEKIKRLSELLTVISEDKRYGEDVEINGIPEKVSELLDLVKN